MPTAMAMTTTGTTQVAALENGEIRQFSMTPEEIGLPRVTMDALKGGDAAANAAALRGVLEGQPGAYRDIVVLNAAAALVIADKVTDLKQGREMAEAAIDDGSAHHVLMKLVEVSNG